MGNCGVIPVWKIIKEHKDIFAVQLQAGNKIDNSRMKQLIPEQLGEDRLAHYGAYREYDEK